MIPMRPRPRVPAPRPRASWYDAADMTLCIGALSDVTGASPSIVLCFDTKVANEAFGSESEYKFYPLSKQFVALVAGRPGRSKELATIYQERLLTADLSHATYLDALREPLQIIKKRHAAAYIGRCLGFPYDDFLNNGDKWLGKERMDKYLADIEENAIGVSMILAGFIGNKPILCELRDDGIEDVTNFCLIGTGVHSAEPALHARTQVRQMPLADTMYNVYEAKKAGESSPYVGASTRMYIIHPANEKSEGHIRAQLVTPTGKKFLDGLYKRYGPKPVKGSLQLPEGSLETGFFNFPKGY